ncbi:helix-turn-helix transcriptional regulator [Pseudoalteromonas sp. MT33b]|uniref:helix-turn-helix transcriptional regulator n=1 Tax=Pseudoalteromonas TaxID=53246 RepID=UPI0007C5233B|nr:MULTISPECIES: helix-turn-helix transcriptional regulator [Pseudoalteromonas]QLJ09760.1 helix-turn-helix transcriptional regulator [Pseudoalteromonas sp. JSTW]QMW15970.1 helix-turn-helix transcriptional regulator [Pseudoalteromonas sp. MT33b]
MKSNGLVFEDIRNKLHEKDILLTDIAEALKVSRSHVYSIAKRLNKSQPVAEAICSALELTLEEVFGDTYVGHQPRGRKDRASRKQQVINAIRNKKPIPAPTYN